MNTEPQVYCLVLKLCYDATWGRKAGSSQHFGTHCVVLTAPQPGLMPSPILKDEAVTISPPI